MKTCGLIRQKKVNGKTSIYVKKDKWITYLSQYEVINVEISISETSVAIDNKPTRKKMMFICIGTKSSSSYLKVTSQLNRHILPRIIKMCRFSYNFLKLISTDILETICCSKDESVYDLVICKKLASNCSKSSSTTPNNPPIL